MSVLMRAEVPGMTAEQFEALFVPIIGQFKAFPGFIANASGPATESYQVTEVWESQEAHERWVREVIIPSMQRAGLTVPPSIQYLPLDRFFTR
jgi:heme-degrading monooxygenase HmoA